MNKERKQARELLELEIKLARLKVTAAQIRQEKSVFGRNEIVDN